MACSGPTLHKSPFVLQLNLEMGQISVWLDPSLMSQFHIWQILGFGLDPLPPFGTMSLNPVFFILKASLSAILDVIIYENRENGLKTSAYGWI